MTSFNKIFMLSMLGIAFNSYAENLLIENNYDIVLKESELNALKQDRIINKSSFFPELNLVTGIGSEYTQDKTETEKGGMLYLDSKINFFNGFKDLKNQNILDEKVNKTLIEKEIAMRKVKSNLVRLIEEKRVLKNIQQLLTNEININQGQEMMAKKKVEAGLNTDAELLDFQIKEASLKNEISLIDINIQQKDSELLNLVSHQMNVEAIEQTISKEIDITSNLKNPNEDLDLDKKVMMADLKVAELEVSKSKSSYSPRLDLEAKAGKITPTSHLFKDKSEHQIAINLTIPLFSGFSTNAEVQKTINDRFVKESALKNFNANYESQINNEKKRIELNKLLLKNNEQVLNKAIKFYSQSLVEYRRGIKNSTDIILASDRVLEIRRKLIELNSQIKTDIYVFNNRFEN